MIRSRIRRLNASTDCFLCPTIHYPDEPFWQPQAFWPPDESVRNQAPRPAKPNFVVILMEDLGCRDLGIYGAHDLKTPNIDALGESGDYFYGFHAGCLDYFSHRYWGEPNIPTTMTCGAIVGKSSKTAST